MFGCRGKVLAVVCRVFRLDLRLVYCLPCLVSQEVSISLPVLALYKYISIHMLFLLEEKTVFLVKKEFISLDAFVSMLHNLLTYPGVYEGNADI